jgi:hypothetical protein
MLLGPFRTPKPENRIFRQFQLKGTVARSAQCGASWLKSFEQHASNKHGPSTPRDQGLCHVMNL